MKTIENDILKVLISEEELTKRVKEIADQVAQDYEDKDPLFVGVLRGSFMFFADLMRYCPIHSGLDFMAVSSYNNGTSSSGVVKINYDIKADLTGRNIILVEDILDSGKTLNYLREMLLPRKPASIKIATLLDKPERRQVDLTADYSCFSVPDEFVVGYGLDFGEKYRNLPYIGILKAEVYEGMLK